MNTRRRNRKCDRELRAAEKELEEAMAAEVLEGAPAVSRLRTALVRYGNACRDCTLANLVECFRRGKRQESGEKP